MPTAYSFESDLKFKDAVKMFNAIDDWVRKPNLDGKWLIRDNDRWGDYLSYYAYDETDRQIVKTISIFFDMQPMQVTLRVTSAKNATARRDALERAWRSHEAYVL